MKQQTFSEALATKGTEFTEKLFLSPSTRQPLLQPGYVEMGKNAHLCVLCDLCGRTSLISGRPNRSRSKLGVRNHCPEATHDGTRLFDSDPDFPLPLSQSAKTARSSASTRWTYPIPTSARLTRELSSRWRMSMNSPASTTLSIAASNPAAGFGKGKG